MSVTFTKKWGPIIYVPRDMVVTPEYTWWAPEPDVQKHLDALGLPTCFLAWANISRSCKGWWFTGNIPIANLVKGDPTASQIKLTGFGYNKEPVWGGPLPTDEASFLVEVDGTRIIDRPLANGIERTEQFNQLLTGTNIKFGLYQIATAGAGSWIEQHVWGYKVFGEYLSTTPPVSRTLSVRVYDAVLAKPIQGATAILMSGISIIASGQTDANGLVTLNGSDQTYLLKVHMQDYIPYPFEASIDLTLGNGSIDVPLTHVAPPPFELPWWWPIPVAAVGAGIIYWIFFRVPTPERPPIYVVK